MYYKAWDVPHISIAVWQYNAQVVFMSLKYEFCIHVSVCVI